ncbi:MAG: Gar1/Naf1 family protein [Candidatus Bathyarchaeota archaeon]|nr:Gar1/Naf1 family protein [Candidatus Bathyarchaeota archaeon]
MRRLGRILHVTPSKNFVINIENLPRIGEIVVDEDLRTVGKISDIFGPVDSPYATVKPTIRELQKLVHKMLYVAPSRGERRKSE